jgi:hypothetical protein
LSKPRRIDEWADKYRVYRAAGYGGPWNPDPGKIRVTTELCREVLPDEESDIRPFSDDQNIVVGYACGDERTNYLPVAHWISGELGRRLFARLRSDLDLSATFGPDFKILSSLECLPGRDQDRMAAPRLEQSTSRGCLTSGSTGCSCLSSSRF